MKKKICSFILLFSSSAILHAIPIAYEGFDYTEGLLTGNGGFGWNNNWSGDAFGSSSGTLSVEATDLPRPNGFSAPSVTGIARSGYAYRQLSGILDMASGTYYISALLRAGNIDGNVDIKLDNDGKTEMGFGLESSTNVYVQVDTSFSRLVFPIGQSNTVFVVAKITAGSSQDILQMKIYEQGDTVGTEPASWDLEQTGDSASGNINVVNLYSASQTGAFDEFRIGTEWADVILPGFSAWAISYGLPDLESTITNDFDLDGMNNLAEYALNSNPTNEAVRGVLNPSILNIEGSNWFEIVYPEITTDSQISYTLKCSSGLMNSSWSNCTDVVRTEGSPVENYRSVTNRIPVEGKSSEYLRLDIHADY